MILKELKVFNPIRPEIKVYVIKSGFELAVYEWREIENSETMLKLKVLSFDLAYAKVIICK